MKLARRGFLSSLVAMPPAVAIAAASPMPRVESDPNIPGSPAPPPIQLPDPLLQPYFEGWKQAQIEREYARQRLEVLTLFAASNVNAALCGAFGCVSNVSADVCDDGDMIVFRDLGSPGQRVGEHLFDSDEDHACAAKMTAFSTKLEITQDELAHPETFADQIHTEGLIESLHYKARGRKPLFIVSRGFRDFIPAAAPISAIVVAPSLIMRGVLSYDLESLTQVVSFEATLGLALPKPEPVVSIRAVSSRHIESMQEQVARAVADCLRNGTIGSHDFAS